MNFVIALTIFAVAHIWFKRYKWYRYLFVPKSSIEASRKLVEEYGYSEEEVDYGLRRENLFRSGDWVGVSIVGLIALGVIVYFIGTRH